MTEVVRETAHAKINPYLRVLGKRPDGYHEIETLILPISLADHVAVSPRREGFGLRITGPLADRVPDGEDNLALRAARALAEATREGRGADILVDKHVPVAAGLGGGSSDAAATLRALDRLWGVGAERLLELAAKIGSDVPALLHRKPVIAHGRGERVEPINLPITSWVLLTQPFGVSSGDAYRWWDEGGGVSGPDPEDVLEALTSGDADRAGSLLFNDLEASVSLRYPEIAEANESLLAAGSLGVIMSGSGPTVGGLARDDEHAREIARAVGGTAVTSINT